MGGSAPSWNLDVGDEVQLEKVMGEEVEAFDDIIALCLATDESKFVTGAELVIDGGYTARQEACEEAVEAVEGPSAWAPPCPGRSGSPMKNAKLAWILAPSVLLAGMAAQNPGRRGR